MAYFCDKMKKGLCKNGIYYYMYYSYGVHTSLSIVLDLKTLFQCSTQCEELTSIIPRKGLQLCFQTKLLQLHFTGKSIFLRFKYFSCANTYRFSSILWEKHQSLITEKVIPITLRFGQLFICKYSETLKLKATAKLLTGLSNSTAVFYPPCSSGLAY